MIQEKNENECFEIELKRKNHILKNLIEKFLINSKNLIFNLKNMKNLDFKLKYEGGVNFYLSKNKSAFTLVELIIVVTIITILATIAFLSFSKYP